MVFPPTTLTGVHFVGRLLFLEAVWPRGGRMSLRFQLRGGRVQIVRTGLTALLNFLGCKCPVASLRNSALPPQNAHLI